MISPRTRGGRLNASELNNMGLGRLHGRESTIISKARRLLPQNRVKTPLLIVHGDLDPNVPYYLSGALFVGLRRLENKSNMRITITRGMRRTAGPTASPRFTTPGSLIGSSVTLTVAPARVVPPTSREMPPD